MEQSARGNLSSSSSITKKLKPKWAINLNNANNSYLCPNTSRAFSKSSQRSSQRNNPSLPDGSNPLPKRHPPKRHRPKGPSLWTRVFLPKWRQNCPPLHLPLLPINSTKCPLRNLLPFPLYQIRSFPHSVEQKHLYLSLQVVPHSKNYLVIGPRNKKRKRPLPKRSPIVKRHGFKNWPPNQLPFKKRLEN